MPPTPHVTFTHNNKREVAYMNKPVCRALALGLALASVGAHAWTLEEAAKPYKGTTIKAIFLDRPGYAAAIKLLPQFEKATGIKVSYETVPYENSREREVLSFTSGDELDVVLTDVVWIGEFAGNGWLEPVKTFTGNKALADPELKLDGFFPILLKSFGGWGDELYGLPFDNYSGLLFYNKCLLKDAGFDKPPATWDELLHTYAPKLTDAGKGQYAYALQSRRGESGSASVPGREQSSICAIYFQDHRRRN